MLIMPFFGLGIQSIVSSMILTGPMRLDSINMVYYMAPISFVSFFPIIFAPLFFSAIRLSFCLLRLYMSTPK